MIDRVSLYFQVPGTTVGDPYLTSSEIEIGMGIHNEAGFKRVSPVPPLSELVQTLLDLLLSKSEERGFLSTQGSGKDKVVLLVNNLGGVSELELAGIAREATTALSARDVRVLRVISGTFMVTRCSPLRTYLALTLMWRRRA
jgi:triose/dihydroxyacetone kinase / FAD-AMP lyase (cyclizing)